MVLRGYIQRVTVNAGVASLPATSFTSILFADGEASTLPVSFREATEMGVGIYEFSFTVPIDDTHSHYHLRVICTPYYIDSGFEFYPQEVRCGIPITIAVQGSGAGIVDWVTYLSKDGLVTSEPVTVTEVAGLGVGIYEVSFVPAWDVYPHHYELRITSAVGIVDTGVGFEVAPGRLADKPTNYPQIRGMVELVGIKVGYRLQTGAVLRKKWELEFTAAVDESQDPALPLSNFPFVSKRFSIFDIDGTRYIADAVLPANDQITPPGSKYAFTVYCDGSVLYYEQFSLAASENTYPPIMAILNQQTLLLQQ